MGKHLQHLVTINLELINENMHNWINTTGIFCQDWNWDKSSRRNDNTRPGPVYGTVSFKNKQHAIEFKMKWL